MALMNLSEEFSMTAEYATSQGVLEEVNRRCSRFFGHENYIIQGIQVEPSLVTTGGTILYYEISFLATE